MGTIESMLKDSAIDIESMLKDCEIDTDSKILIYIQGDANDDDCVGELYELSFDKDTVEYLQVILSIYANDFNSHHWETSNNFEKYGIGNYSNDYDDDDEDEDEDYDDDAHVNYATDDYDAEYDEGESPYAEVYDPEATAAARKKMKLELIYDFMEKYLPSTPEWCEKCHSVTDLKVYIICSEYSGELLCGDVSDDEIVRVWEANKTS
ncbi:MAG: hypothetical protein K6D97_01015 [Clostridia bacterium]|nr:hypothetical protein [Clostridia bacterium]